MKNRNINTKFFEQQRQGRGRNGGETLIQSNTSNVLLKKLEQCKATGNINLSSCQPPLQEIPGDIFALYFQYSEDNHFWEMEPLKSMDFSFNQITALPKELLQLQDIQVIKVRSNRLSSFFDESDSFENFQYLRILDLSLNQITQLSEQFGQLISLKELNIGNNQLSYLPPVLFQLGTIRILDVQHNQISSLLPEDRTGKGGRTLSAYHSPSLPVLDSKLSLLISLNLSNNRLAYFPAELLHSLTALEVLDLSCNQLSDFPVIQQNSHLKYLNLSQNHLSEFPRLLIVLPVLSQLILSYNRISHIPLESLQQVTSALHELLLHNNQLTRLPEEIEYCQVLKVLDVSNNSLADIPAAVGYLPQLQILKLEGNCIKTIRQTLLIKPTEELKKYLRTRGSSLLHPSEEGGGVGDPRGIVRDRETVVPTASFDSKGMKAGGGSGALSGGSAINRMITDRIMDVNPKQGLLNLSKLQLSSMILKEEFLEEFRQFGSQLATVSKIDVSSNQLQEYPQEFLAELVRDYRGSSSISYVNLAHNELGKRSTILSKSSTYGSYSSVKMYNQCTIDLSYNSFTNYETLANVFETYLEMSADEIVGMLLHHNPLRFLPTATYDFFLHKCRNLEHLEVQYCGLTSLGGWDLRYFPHLKYLDVSNNRIEDIPSSFEAEMMTLEFLSVENNELTIIPTFLGLLPNLKTLLVQGNPQKAIRPQIVQQGSQKVIEYLRSRHPQAVPGTAALVSQGMPRAPPRIATEGVTDRSGRTGNSIHPPPFATDHSEQNFEAQVPRGEESRAGKVEALRKLNSRKRLNYSSR